MKERILFEDKDLIVCHKQAGVPVQSARIGQRDMVSMLMNYLAEKGDQPQVHVVHRLDQPVEGIVVFAKTQKAAAELSKQIQQGSMRKIYQAVCCVEDMRWDDREARGQEKELVECERNTGDRELEQMEYKRRKEAEKKASYTLVDYLIKDGRTNSSMVGKKGDRDAKKAELNFSVIGYVKKQEEYEKGEDIEEKKDTDRKGENTKEQKDIKRKRENIKEQKDTDSKPGDRNEKVYLLAEIELKTGRHHQIRVQMAYAGLPIYGDQKYNEKWQEYLMDMGYETQRIRRSENEWGTDKGRGIIQDRRNHVTDGGRLALCAVSLTFKHPIMGKKMTFEVEPENQIFEMFK